MITASSEGIDCLEAYLSSPAGKGAETFTRLVSYLKEAITEERFDEVIPLLRRIPPSNLDYAGARKLTGIHRHLESRTRVPGKEARLAVLGGFTTSQLTDLIRLFSFLRGASLQIHESEYGVFRQEILDPSSSLYRFEPDTIFLAVSWRDLSRWPELNDSSQLVGKKQEQELAEWVGLWQTAHDRLGCQVIQDNFAPPMWRSLGNHEARHPASLGRFVAGMNAALQDHAPVFVTIHDVAHLAAFRGYGNWNDPRFFHLAKFPCAPHFLTDYADSVASLVTTRLGLSKKCLVLDLDNTLWGGILGDQGVKGITLGQGQPEGEAFLEFQQYLKQLRQRGVLLAVCSKNDDQVAREPFLRHPDMILSLEDISCFVANWRDKPDNLSEIAQTLNLGLDSLVLVDDNPVERALVRRVLPEVTVPELPVDPSAYIQALDRLRLFEVLSLASEDLKRTDYYRENAIRAQHQASYHDIGEFLRSLEMKARSAPIDNSSLERSAQLINRTNQFNLTNRRYSQADLAALVKNESWITRSFWLSDRFGDNGLISVILARLNGTAIEMDTWVMSCRVFKRGMEKFAFKTICTAALQHGVSAIRGEYVPSPRNSFVKDLYAELGFKQVGHTGKGITRWELKLPANEVELDSLIEEMPGG